MPAPSSDIFFQLPPVTYSFKSVAWGEDYEKFVNCKFLYIQKALETLTYGNSIEGILGGIDRHNKSTELLEPDK